MAFSWKLLYNSRYIVRYVTYILVFLFIYTLLHTLSKLYSTEYSNVELESTVYKCTTLEAPPSSPKYILVWNHYYLTTNSRKEQIFPNLDCRIKNCVFTENRNLLNGDYTQFDALLFYDDVLKANATLPKKRADSQLYIFTTIESSYNIPACELYNDDFFNWTFTYRLASDVLWPYFVVRNATHHIVAPRINVAWQKPITKRISPSIRAILRHKTKAAAWLVSHCNADSARDEYLSRLQEHLFHFSLKIDVYGGCSKVKCTYDDCEEMFTRDYYFYMAFENSFSEDYVTEKVLHGYNNYAVPIVYGGANYTRFLPPGSYLNARELHPYNLAAKMKAAIQNPRRYEAYFKWTHTYTIDADLPQYHPLCSLCEALNSDKAKLKKTYKTFRLWWNGHNGMKWCLPVEYWNETSLVNVNSWHLFDMY